MRIGAVSQNVLACAAALLGIAHAGDGSETYYFSGAVQVGQDQDQGSYAVQAQCPAGNPVSCDAIGEPEYCCPSNNRCEWSNSKIACCPQGKTCNGWGGGGGGGGGWEHTSQWQPSTTQQWTPQQTWAPQTTTDWNAGGGGAAWGGQATTTSPQAWDGNYCSTLVAVGPNLPTTEAGDCGTILVVESGQTAREILGWARMIGLLLTLNAFGGWLLMIR
ncbi:hypothetical protein KC340_g11440 [Hortaea werneckii]|nr:hypothetical protein KC342_g14685 [Hortaea werneckii]KAI7102480.1 hypothetical protein KC339_g5992 [Hortaea werneckii]KAI7240436.1 hypothetical protein KC365_g3806 [Hortaea werneckii]KAI7307340.1 hypothetical protein KC340_g11440 [Hortaea werneckii]